MLTRIFAAFSARDDTSRQGELCCALAASRLFDLLLHIQHQPLQVFAFGMVNVHRVVGRLS